jgi:hypothetical protein
MIVCSAVQLRQSGLGAKRADFAYFNDAPERIAKRQLSFAQALVIGRQVTQRL